MNKKTFRRELNHLTRKTPKKVMRKIFSAVLSQDKAKSAKQKKANTARKKQKSAPTASSSSKSSADDDMSINVMDKKVTFDTQLQKQRDNRTTRMIRTDKPDNQSNESTKTPEEPSGDMDLAKELKTLGEERDAADN